jgi:hypothetical protein
MLEAIPDILDDGRLGVTALINVAIIYDSYITTVSQYWLWSSQSELTWLTICEQVQSPNITAKIVSLKYIAGRLL